MPNIEMNLSVKTIQSAIDELVVSPTECRHEHLVSVCEVILQRFNRDFESKSIDAIFAKSMPKNVQGFTAVWLLRALYENPNALQIGDTERLVAELFDQVFGGNVYAAAELNTKMQTFEKIKGLTDFMQDVLLRLEELHRREIELEQIGSIREDVLRTFNHPVFRQFYVHLLGRELIDRNRMLMLFGTIEDYVKYHDADPLYRRDQAIDACDDLIAEVKTYGTRDAEVHVASIAQRLKESVARHFESLEVSRWPEIEVSVIEKKYPLKQIGETIDIRLRIRNNGTGPARDFRLDEVTSDSCIELIETEIGFGTIQPSSNPHRGLRARVVAPDDDAQLLLEFSWERLGGREKIERVIKIENQMEQIDWNRAKWDDPYSLDAVEIRKDLKGRGNELERLVHLATLKTVRSAFIHGQKRVGKTSLANTLRDTLVNDTRSEWIVVNITSGSFRGSNPKDTMVMLGKEIVAEMKSIEPVLIELQEPEFTAGLAPLVRFIRKSMEITGKKLMVILDEFDELPFELLRRGDLGDSLFQPIREISNIDGCGMILVGGEGMRRMMNVQGDRLNRFDSIEIGYFDFEEDWSDFVAMICDPVDGIMEIGNLALETMFKLSAGNPFFAKTLAGQLYRDMVNKKHSFVGELDVLNAHVNLRSATGQHVYAHFWTDGVVDDVEDPEQIRALRRLVLVAVGRAWRKENRISFGNVWNEVESGGNFGFSADQLRLHFEDFVSRGILVESDTDRFEARVPMFQAWLQERGVGELMAQKRTIEFVSASLRHEEDIRVKDEEINEYCRKFDRFIFDGRRIETADVREWLNQFDQARDQRLMFRLLCAVRIYDDGRTRSKMKDAFAIVSRHTRQVIENPAAFRRDVYVSSFDESWAKSGPSLCRMFASENRLIGENVLDLRSVGKRIQGNTGVKRLVLVDDFAATGRTLMKGLEREMGFLKEVNEAGIQIFVVVTVGFAAARSSIERFIERNRLELAVYFCDELGDEHRAFSETSLVFPDAEERNLARRIADEKGVVVERKIPLGFGNCQALVVFSHNCPNNTLPVFWSRNAGWKPIFPRH